VLDEINASLTDTNSTIRSLRIIDPTPLAKRLWQSIWVATGKNAEKCLYNIVELFIFKFMSDLRLLSEDISFTGVLKKAQDSPAEALDYYARNSRTKIYKLFPKGLDGTTIVNGTIFVNENGDANPTQSLLFKKCLEHLQKYSDEVGGLTKINKQFKTKLYESFMKQEVAALGQYFTPRKIIQSMIRMGGLDEQSFQYNGKRICDPFCGVGGFLLEILNMNDGMKANYKPQEGIIHLNFVLEGFDKGFESDEERIVILAKANMLIYLAEIIFNYPNFLTEFARIFNDTFTLFRDNLGTFGHIIKKDELKYDYIFSNPPYVTKGSSLIKEEIKNTPHTRGEYPINALGLEGLAVEWIVKSLRGGGRAFIIIPDGILGRVGERKLRNYILAECFLDAIVSLPRRTFFTNDEHTYILVITKKNDPSDVQKAPVFTYLVSNIGERLTSVKRYEIDENDLPEMETLFGRFSGDRSNFTADEKNFQRCKIMNINKFRQSDHWVIDRWWSRKERIALGIIDSVEFASKSEVDTLIGSLNNAINDYDKYVGQISLDSYRIKEVALNDPSLFNLFIGNRVLQNELPDISGEIPIYSANVFEPFGYINKSNINDYETPYILWGIDGNFDFNIMPKGVIFATTDHCGAIQILDPAINPEYLLYALQLNRIDESFDRSFRASLFNMRKFKVKIPINPDGSFDVQAQEHIATAFMGARHKKEGLVGVKNNFLAILDRYIASSGMLK
jgi:type I restriction-modification system DNA methylase subunit